MPNGLIAAAAIASLCAVRIAAADTIYVSNEKDNTVTIVDGATLTPVKKEFRFSGATAKRCYRPQPT